MELCERALFLSSEVPSGVLTGKDAGSSLFGSLLLLRWFVSRFNVALPQR